MRPLAVTLFFILLCVCLGVIVVNHLNREPQPVPSVQPETQPTGASGETSAPAMEKSARTAEAQDPDPASAASSFVSTAAQTVKMPSPEQQAVAKVAEGNAKISGLVVHSETNQPAPALTFSIQKQIRTGQDLQHSTIGTLETDAEGRFSHEIEEPGQYALCLEHDALALCDRAYIHIGMKGQQIENLLFRVGPGASVSGRIYDAVNRQGIPDVRIALSNELAATTTNAQGFYQLMGVRTGQQRLYLSNTGAYVNTVQRNTGGKGIQITAGAPITNLDFPLKKGIELRGIVVNEQGETMTGGHASIQGYTVIDGNRRYAYQNTTIDQQGKFVFNGVDPETDYQYLQVYGNLQEPDKPSISYWPYYEHGDIQLWTGERRFVLEIAGKVCGQVFDAATRQPISEFEYCAIQGRQTRFNAHWGMSFSSKSDPEGRFCCTASRDNTTVFVRADGYSIETIQLATPTPGETVEFTAYLKAGATVEGVVYNMDGSPISNAMIFTGPLPAGSRYKKDRVAQARTDNEGKFKADVETGTQLLTAWAPNYNAQTQQINVQVGETGQVEFTLNSGARITGLITMNGQPVEAYISYNVRNGGTIGMDGISTTNGRYEISGLPSGSGTISIRTRTAVPQSTIQIVETAEGQETVVDYDFTAGTATLTGKITSGGEPVPRAHIEAYRIAQDGNFSKASGRVEMGVYTLENVPAGDIELAVSVVQGYDSRVHREPMTVEPNQVIEHDIDISPQGTATVQGQVILGDPDIKLGFRTVAIFEGRLQMQDSNFEEYIAATALVVNVTPDANMFYQIPNVPAGEYSLVFKGMTDKEQPIYGLEYIQVKDNETQTVNLQVR